MKVHRDQGKLYKSDGHGQHGYYKVIGGDGLKQEEKKGLV